jgi:hypothetical protein
MAMPGVARFFPEEWRIRPSNVELLPLACTGQIVEIIHGIRGKSSEVGNDRTGNCAFQSTALVSQEMERKRMAEGPVRAGTGQSASPIKMRKKEW